VVTGVSAGVATIRATAADGSEGSADKSITVTQPISDENGVVINGVRWATRNVDKPGTFVARQENAGMFYQWNRKIGWSSTDPMVNSEGGTEWDTSPMEGEKWEKENDPCPMGWRVPTSEELLDFRNTTHVTSTWTTENGVNGRWFTDIVSNASIFMPATGSRANNDGGLGAVGKTGCYWSSTPINGGGGAFSLGFGESYTETLTLSGNIGRCVRCVKSSEVGINEVSKDTETATVIGYFDALGRRLNEEPKQGFYIILYDNGKTKKVMKK
jgi:uncharacterized protein (TIGR02145 family)